MSGAFCPAHFCPVHILSTGIFLQPTLKPLQYIVHFVACSPSITVTSARPSLERFQRLCVKRPACTQYCCIASEPARPNQYVWFRRPFQILMRLGVNSYAHSACPLSIYCHSSLAHIGPIGASPPHPFGLISFALNVKVV